MNELFKIPARNLMTRGLYITLVCMVCVTSVYADWEQEANWASPITPASSGSGSGGGFSLLLTEASGTTVGTNETAITPELKIAARALRNDPLRIYEFVRNEIHYNAPTYGIKLGAHGCLMAGQGNDWDQAALLSALLRISGVSTRYATSIVYYNTAMLSRWCGYGGNGDYNEVGGRVFYNGGWQTGAGTGTGDAWHAKYAPGDTEIWTGIRRIWVEADLDGQWVSLDPAFKDASISEVTNLASLMSYTQTNLLTEALTGATTNANWVQNLNDEKIDSELTSLTTNLLQEIREHHDAEAIQALVGGRIFSREMITNFPSALPGAEDIASSSRTTFDHVPSAQILTLTVSYQNITNTFLGYELGGRPLTITHDASASYSPKLWLDGELVATGTSTTTGQTHALNWGVDQPYGQAGWADDSYQQNLKSPGAYVLVYDFGSASRKRTLHAAQEFERLLASGVSPTSEAALLKAMNAAAAGGLEQWSLVRRMLGWVADSLNYAHHFLGVFGQEEGYYVDLPGIRTQNLPFSVDSSDWETSFKADSFFASALEHGILEQTQGTNRPAVSTIKIMAENNAAGFKSFLANSANWTTVRAALTNYAPAVLAELDSRMDANSVIFLPEDGSTVISQWAGHGYAHFRSLTSGNNWSASMGMIISGGYSGGFSGSPDPFDVPVSQNIVVNVVSPAPRQNTVPTTTVGDPVDVRTGHFLYGKPLLALGGPPPRGQRVSLSYSSGEGSRQGQLGKGWRHSLDIQITKGSDGAASFGTRQTSDAAALLAATYIVSDLLADDAGPKEWGAAALVAQWALDQMNENMIIVRQGDRSLSYLRQPDGQFSPPPSVTSELILTNGVYRLIERFGKEYRFDSEDNIESIVDADGNSMDFAYNAQTNLQTVTDSYGRALTFSYTSGKVTQISDGTGRDVDLEYTGDDLTQITDVEGHEWDYHYTNHQMKVLTDPLDQIIVSNIYNSVGQVVTQFNDLGHAWSIYSGLYMGTEVDPAGGETTHRFDEDGRNLGIEDPLGHRTHTTYTPRGQLETRVDALGFTTTYQYDSKYNLTNRIDALSNKWSYVYDDDHHLITETDPLGHSTQYQYDENHHLINTVDALTNETVITLYTSGSHKGLPHTITDPNGNLSTMTYDSYGNVLTLARTDGGVVTNTWNARGDLLISRDSLAHETVFTYNNRRQQTSITDAQGNVVSKVYDAAGYQTAVIDPLSNQTVTAWTPTYKIASVTYPDSGVVSNLYDSRDRLISVVDANGNITSNAYDAAGRLIAVTDALSNTTHFVHDAVGQVISQTNALGHATDFEFDALGRVVQTTDPLGNTVSNTYDAVGRLIAVTDANGYTTEFEFDALGRMTVEVKPDGVTETFTYDANGNLTAVQNGLGAVRSFSHDGMNRVTNETDAVNHTRSFVFDSAGNLLERHDPDGSVIQYEYDTLNRLTDITYPDTTSVHYAYTDVGQRSYQSNETAEIHYQYDTMNRLTVVTQSVLVATEFGGGGSSVQSVVQYSYDLNGNRTNLVYLGSNAVAHTYNSVNRLAEVTDWDSRVTEMTYDNLHRKTGVHYPSLASSTWGWDPASRLTQVQHHNGSSNIVDRVYTLDAHGNIIAMEINAGLLPQITAGIQRLQQNAADELTEIQTKANPDTPMWTDDTVYYDLKGNLTSDGQNSFTYNYENRLQSASTVQSEVHHVYAADGTLVGSATMESGTTNLTLYVIDHADPLRRPIAELDETGNLIRSFIWGNGLIAQVKADGTTHYVHADGQGSTLALTDTNNVATDQWFYSPYGEELASTGTTDIPYRWVGGHGVRKASEDLYFMRHRTYHAGVKRFLSLDPSGLNGGVNHYWYGDNNPLFFIDPFGLDSGSSSNPSFQNPSSGYLTAAQWQDNSDFRSARAVGTSGLLLGSSLSGYSDAGATIAFNNAAALLSAPGEEIIAGALFSGVSRLLGNAPKAIHKNSLDYVGDTHVYRVKGPDGTTYKIGESAQGVRVRDGASIRAEQQARQLTRETGDAYRSQIRKTFPDKRSAREYETKAIERFRRMYGDDALPGNKINR